MVSGWSHWTEEKADMNNIELPRISAQEWESAVVFRLFADQEVPTMTVPEQIAARKQCRDRLGLDRGGIGIALGLKRTDKRLGQAKIGKIGHENLSKIKKEAEASLGFVLGL